MELIPKILDNLTELPYGDYTTANTRFAFTFKRTNTLDNETFIILNREGLALANTFGVEFVYDMLNKKKIRCIKMVREKLGVGLWQAKLIYEIMSGEVSPATHNIETKMPF